MDEDFFYNIYSIMMEIPRGKVVSYGQLARLAGRDKNARVVGKALRCANMYGEYPCHRVVGSKGRLALGFSEQKQRLLDEGVVIKTNGNVDMKQCQWNV